MSSVSLDPPRGARFHRVLGVGDPPPRLPDRLVERLLPGGDHRDPFPLLGACAAVVAAAFAEVPSVNTVSLVT